MRLHWLPACVSGPIQRSVPDQVVDWVFDVVVRLHILGVTLGNLALDQLDGACRVGVRTEIVAKQKRVALIGIPVDPDMDVCPTAGPGLIE